MATINDIVLIHLEDDPIFFARIEDIQPDHKKDWFQIKLLMLQIPLQTVTWILKDAYINGDDFFMGGKKMRLEPVVCPGDDGLTEDDPNPFEPAVNKGQEQSNQPEHKDPDKQQDNIISFSAMKNSRKSGPGDEPDPDIG